MVTGVDAVTDVVLTANVAVVAPAATGTVAGTVAAAVLRHRIILNFDAHAEGQTPESILGTIIPAVAAAVHQRA